MHDRRPLFETLEPRHLLAVATVDTELDVVDINDGVTSLREAIFAANTLSGANTIEFDPTLAGQTILLQHGELLITDELTIDGLGANLLTIDAGNGGDDMPATADGFRIFQMVNGVSMEIRKLTLTGGDAVGNGGAIQSNGHLTIRDSVIASNAASGAGGGIYHDSGNLLIVGSTITGNWSDTDGGGIYDGFYPDDVTIEDSLISGNYTQGSGGGVGTAPYPYFNNFAVVNSTITGNTAQVSGGGIFAGYGNVEIIRSTVTQNSAAQGGAGVDAGAVALVLDSDISDNFGTGIFLQANSYLSELRVRNSLVSGNHVGIDFAANRISPVLSIENSTVSHNLTKGVTFEFNSINDTASIRNSTIVNNGSIGVEIPFDVFNLSVQGSIVSGNLGGNLALSYGAALNYLTVSHSLIGDNTGTTFTEAPVGSPDADGNLIGGPVNGIINPQLAPLADNGGPTLTHAVLPGSPAIDAGDPNAVVGVNGVQDFDQRGFPYRRIANGDDVGLPRIDIGAFERQDPPADFDLDGDTDGRDFLFWQRGYDPTATTATKGDGDADGDMDVDGDDLVAWEATFGVGAMLSAASSHPSAERPLAAELVDLAMAVELANDSDGVNPSPSPSLRGRGTIVGDAVANLHVEVDAAPSNGDKRGFGEIAVSHHDADDDNWIFEEIGAEHLLADDTP